VFTHPDAKHHIPVPRHKQLKAPLVRGILKQAKVNEDVEIDEASAAWQRKRQQRLEHDQHTCQGCGITAAQLEELSWSSLQVHHKNAGPPDYRYPSFGNEQITDLLTLCSICHDGITNSVRQQRFKLDPRKQVQHTSVAAPSLSIPSQLQRVRPDYDPDHNFGREPIAVPQRSDRRSSQSLFQGDQGDFG
jgi:hypothetical protein